MVFEKVTPESVGIHSKGILNFLDAVERFGVEMHSMMLLRHGKICAEGWWKPYNPFSPHMMFSFSKSLTSTAVGFARQEGKLQLEDKLCDIFPDKMPENPSENLLACTVWDLLTMSCGHETEINTFDVEAPDWITTFFAHEFKYKPGTCFMYNTAGTNLLCAALGRRTGEDLTAYLTPRLLEPLGIHGVECFTLPDGTEMGGAGYRLKTEDMARFILFVAQRGMWEGKQLLDSAWFDLATGKQVETLSPANQPGDPDWRCGYGFQFWQCVPENVVRADGAFGQFGVMFRDSDTILILQSASPHGQDQLTAAWAELLPAITNEERLPESPFSHVLKKRLEKAELTPLYPARNDESEKLFSGRPYQPESKLPGLADLIGGIWLVAPAGGTLQNISVAFEAEKAVLTATQDNGVFTLDIGLCGHFTESALNGRTYGAVGHWRSDRRFEWEVRCAESVGGRRMILNFEDDALLLESESTLAVSGGLADAGYTRYAFLKSE